MSLFLDLVHHFFSIIIIALKGNVSCILNLTLKNGTFSVNKLDSLLVVLEN